MVNFAKMKRSVDILLFFLCVLLPVDAFAEGFLQTRADDMRSIVTCLDSLDRTIDNVAEYRKLKENKIVALKSILGESRLSARERWLYSDMLYNECSSFRSADQLEVAQQLLEIADELGDADLILSAKLRQVHTYVCAGAFKEAQELFDRVDGAGLNLSGRTAYLKTNLELQYEAGMFARESGLFQDEYAERIKDIVDEISSLLPADDENVILANERMSAFNGDYSLAYQYNKQRNSANIKASAEKRAEILGNAGLYNLGMGDTLTAISYMTRSAELYLRSGSRQEPVLRRIAESVYPLGEVDRAHRYISLAMDNATFYGSSYRIFEASLSLPEIDRDVYDKAVQQRHNLHAAGIVALAALAALLGLLLVILLQNKSIRRYSSLLEKKGEDLNQMNGKLARINSELQEANLLKSAYIEHTLAEDSMNISRMETLISDIELKVKVHQFDDIVPYIYRSDYLKTRKDMLRRFDQTFMGLFPDFISQVNSILEEGYRFDKVSGKGLPVELRILALMRLGIHKSVTIGEILNISDSTVRNYKTRLRNHSTVPNEEFDAALQSVITPVSSQDT